MAIARNSIEGESFTQEISHAEFVRTCQEVFPKEWSLKLLGEIAYIGSGTTLGRKLSGPVIQLPYLRVANVQDGYLDLSTIKYIDILESEREKWLLKIGDILLTEGGDWDKLGRGTVWNGEIENCIHQNHIFRVRIVDPAFDVHFVNYLLSSFHGKGYFRQASKQSTNLASINQVQLRAFPVLQPPLPEQRRIATVLASVDEAIAATDAVIAQLGKYREAILIAAFNQSFAGGRSGDAIEWRTIRLGDCGDWFGGLTPSMKVSRYWEGGSLPWITPKDMRRTVIADSEDHVSQSAVDETGLRIAPPGSVVFVVRGMILAKRFPVAITTVPSTINQDMRAIVANEKVDGYFLLLTLQKWSDKILSLVKTATHGTKKLDSPELKELSISISPFPEQRRIAEILSAIDDRLALERAERDSLVALKKGLMQVLLTGKVRVPPGVAEEVAPAHA